MRTELRTSGVPEAVIDDAVLILSELLSNACKHGRPLGDALAGDGDVRAAWRVDARGRLVVEVTDGGGPTRPAPATPSVTAHGGRGLNIITALADDWGVRDDACGEVTVWVVVHDAARDGNGREARGGGRADSRTGGRTDSGRSSGTSTRAGTGTRARTGSTDRGAGSGSGAHVEARAQVRAGSEAGAGVGRGLCRDLHPVPGLRPVTDLHTAEDFGQVRDLRQEMGPEQVHDWDTRTHRTGFAPRLNPVPGSGTGDGDGDVTDAGGLPRLAGLPDLPGLADLPDHLRDLAGLDFTEAFGDLD